MQAGVFVPGLPPQNEAGVPASPNVPEQDAVNLVSPSSSERRAQYQTKPGCGNGQGSSTFFLDKAEGVGNGCHAEANHFPEALASPGDAPATPAVAETQKVETPIAKPSHSPPGHASGQPKQAETTPAKVENPPAEVTALPSKPAPTPSRSQSALPNPQAAVSQKTKPPEPDSKIYDGGMYWKSLGFIMGDMLHKVVNCMYGLRRLKVAALLQATEWKVGCKSTSS